MKRVTFPLTIIILLLLVGAALAMSSTNYRLDWFTPLTGTGNSGGAVSSASYSINYTIGQTAIGSSASTNYQIELGYWYVWSIYLPIILR